MNFLKVFALLIPALEALKSSEWNGYRCWYNGDLHISIESNIMSVEFGLEGSAIISVDEEGIDCSSNELAIKFLTTEYKLVPSRNNVDRQNILSAVITPFMIDSKLVTAVTQALTTSAGEEIAARILDSAGLEFFIITRIEGQRPRTLRSIPFTLEMEGQSTMTLLSTTTVAVVRKYYADRNGYPVGNVSILVNGRVLEDSQLMWTVEGDVTVRIVGARVH